MPKLDPQHVVFTCHTSDPNAIRCYARLELSAGYEIDRRSYPFPIPSAFHNSPLVPPPIRERLRRQILADLYSEAFQHIEAMAHAIRGEQRPDGDRFGAVLAAADALAWIDEVRSGFIGEPT